MLHATQYLPELVQLQQQLYESFHRKLDRVEANKTTVAEFIGTIKKSMSFHQPIKFHNNFYLFFIKRIAQKRDGKML